MLSKIFADCKAAQNKGKEDAAGRARDFFHYGEGKRFKKISKYRGT